MRTDDDKAIILQILSSLDEVMPFIGQDVRRLVELYEEKAIFEPTTVRETLEKWSNEHKIVPDEVWSRFMAAAKRLPRPESEDFSWSCPGNEFFCFVRDIKKTIGARSLADRLRPVITTEVRFIYRAQMMEALHQPTTVSFERRIRVLAEVVRNVAEGWYKPILQLALKLSREASGELSGNIPGELGPLLTACGSAGEIPSSILMPELRIVRNSVAHSHTEVNVQHEAVTFVNISRSGRRDVVGPWTWNEFAAFSDSCLLFFWTLTLVLRRHLRLAEAELKSTP